MTEHYVTLFDEGFLPNGLSLHASLERHAGDYALWVLCMDHATLEALALLDLPNVHLIPLEEAETPEVLAVKAGRSRGEYCWTLTPFSPDLVFDRAPRAQRVTYVDADMWLTRSPAAMFAEMEATGAAALITPHNYAREYDQADAYGTYCVQFMPFVRGSSDPIRHWWQQRCLEWCFARPEDGKFGDQKYLDDWPERFGPLVRVLDDARLAQAPWNAVSFRPTEAVTFHFHRLRTISATRVSVGLYRLPRSYRALVYRPYLRDLREAYDVLARAGLRITPQAELLHGWPGLKDRIAFRLLNWRSPTTPYTMSF